MSDFDIETIRCQVRAMDFVRGTPTEIAMWHEDMADSRANLVIEDKAFAQQLRERLLRAIREEGQRMEPTHHGRRPWPQRCPPRPPIPPWAMAMATPLPHPHQTAKPAKPRPTPWWTACCSSWARRGATC